jgi:cytochrome c oxidase assembly factor CtaG
MPPILWIHGDCLRPTNPALLAHPDAPAIFVWDDELLKQYQISLKRIVFMYEALLELPVTIYRGDVITQLTAFADQHQADSIVTTVSPAPRFTAICRQLRQRYRVEVLAEPAFVDIPTTTDIKRFSRYWQVAKSRLIP